MAHDAQQDHLDQVDHAAMGIEKEHPTWSTYWKVAVLLTVITVVEVWIYYTPLKETRAFVPMLLTMSLVKFVTVIAFYMHLRYDHKLFRALFIGPLLIAATSMIGLMFLFGPFHIRIGALH